MTCLSCAMGSSTSTTSCATGAMSRRFNAAAGTPSFACCSASGQRVRQFLQALRFAQDNLAEVLACSLRHLRIEHQLGVAGNGGKRRAEFVRYIADEPVPDGLAPAKARSALPRRHGSVREKIFGKPVNLVKGAGGLEHDALVAFAVGARLSAPVQLKAALRNRRSPGLRIAEATQRELMNARNQARAAEHQNGNGGSNRAAEHSQQRG